MSIKRFKIKDAETGAWHEGFIKVNESILVNGKIRKVDPKTLCWASEFRDMKGKIIYEGDTYAAYGDEETEYQVGFRSGAFTGGPIGETECCPLGWEESYDNGLIEINGETQNYVMIKGNIHD